MLITDECDCSEFMMWEVMITMCSFILYVLNARGKLLDRHVNNAPTRGG